MVERDFLEPITEENIYELKPGEWIWDNQSIIRRAHKKSLGDETVVEPIGFRQIDILDLKDFGTWWNNQPFMLSNFDKVHGREWVYFSEGRFWKFKRSENLSSEDETEFKSEGETEVKDKEEDNGQ